ncbi:MAG: hypothetical protein HUU50_15145 [Candidatus Brocadiae bacterium]|nr:hypothetical protein [Candidatus Brocadiia bacterium]
MEKKVVFTNGYISPISPTKDFGIKEFPNYSSDLKESLQNFCCSQTFLQDKGLNQIVILGCKAGDRTPAVGCLFFADLEYDLKDHENRPTFRLSGNLFVHAKSKAKSLAWSIIPLCNRPESIWQEFLCESNSFEKSLQMLKSCPEFLIYQKNAQDLLQQKKQARFLQIVLFSLIFVCLALFTLLYYQEERNIGFLAEQKELMKKDLYASRKQHKESFQAYQKKIMAFCDRIITQLPDAIWEKNVSEENRNRFAKFGMKTLKEISFDKDTDPKTSFISAKAFLKGVLLYKEDLEKEIDFLRGE